MTRWRATAGLGIASVTLSALALVTVADRADRLDHGPTTTAARPAAGPAPNAPVPVPTVPDPTVASGSSTAPTAAPRTGSGSSPPPAVSRAPAAPQKAIGVRQAEHGATGATVEDASASGGQAVSGDHVTFTAGVGPGPYRVTVRALADQRFDITAAGEMAGTYRSAGHWTIGEALVFVTDPGMAIGVRGTDAVLDWAVIESTGPQLTTRGTEIVGLAGSPVTLRGVNRGAYQRYVDGGAGYNDPAHESEFMIGWGMNAVRIPLSQEYWLNDCSSQYSFVHDEEQQTDRLYRYRELIADEVRRYNAVGMYVLLDLHATTRGRAKECEQEKWPKEMPGERSVDFWRSVGAMFKDNALVGFHLFNEPQFDTAAWKPRDPDGVWRNGGPVHYRTSLLSTKQYSAVGFQTLYDVLRSEVGATNLLFVSGLKWGLDVDVLLRRPLDGYGIVAAPHIYCPDCFGSHPNAGTQRLITGEGPGEPDRVGASDRFPVVVTEFGSADSDAAEFNHDVATWLERNDMGWLAYSWAARGSGKGQDRWGLLAGLGPDRAPHAAGRPIAELLAGLSG